ncbi:MAG: glycosyltransferase [Clostridia bacterium]
MDRVLHIVSSWGTGGVERYIYNYSKYLNKYSFDVLTLRESSNKSIFASDKIRVYHLLEAKGNYLKRINMRKKLLIDFLKKNKYNIVHFDATTADAFILAKAIKKNFSCKIVMHCHATSIEPPNIFLKTILHKFSKIFYSKYADYYIGLSEDTIRWMFPQKSKIDKTVLNCGVEIEKFKFNEDIRNQIRKKHNITNKYVVGTVGRFSKQKNPFFILDIIEECIKMEENFTFLWIGDGEYFNKIREIAKNRGIDKHIYFLGVCENIEEYYSALDLFILPSLYEGNPIACLEAQTNGLKCIISDEITKTANITGSVRFLGIENPKEWATEIMKLKNDCNHVSYLEKISAKGYSVKDNAEKLEKIYDRLEN